MPDDKHPADLPVRLGVRANWRQFAWLVLINAFVGGMLGLERTVVPLIGAEEFRIAATVLVTSFIGSFGLVKALSNLIAGGLADAWGRKRVLLLGWGLGLPVPFVIMWAPAWEWIVAANALLGASQGLAWSMTLLMKVDLVGPKSHGLAAGLNESAGYIAVGITAFLTAYVAARYDLRPEPFYIGVVYAVLGLGLSACVVRETHGHARLESSLRPEAAPTGFWDVFARTTFGDRNLFATSQAGLVNNLNDGMSWGIFPLFFLAHGLGLERIGILKAAYPVIWGSVQVITGPLSDRWGRKGFIVSGMALQAAALILTALAAAFWWWMLAAILLGIGRAMAYPTLIAAVSDASHPDWRARSVAVYRFWRDLGYAIGAVAAGFIADAFGLAWAIAAVGGLTFLSAIIVALVMTETRAAERC